MNEETWQSLVLRFVVFNVYFFVHTFIAARILIILEPSLSLLDSMYFVVETLATIGSGDIMPQRKHWLLVMVFSFFGIALMSGVLSVLFSKPENDKKLTKVETIH